MRTLFSSSWLCTPCPCTHSTHPVGLKSLPEFTSLLVLITRRWSPSPWVHSLFFQEENTLNSLKELHAQKELSLSFLTLLTQESMIAFTVRDRLTLSPLSPFPVPGKSPTFSCCVQFFTCLGAATAMGFNPLLSQAAFIHRTTFKCARIKCTETFCPH